MLLRGVRQLSRDFAVALLWKAPANSVTAKARARQGKARQGNFSLPSINRPLLPPTSPSLQHDDTNTTLISDV